ncbi:MAG: helix-turn-helix domain-containing protein [Xanthobacteraceae bacterium]
MMDVRPIRSEADYAWALREVEPYFQNPPVPGSPAADRFDVLATLLESYENAHVEIPDADPIDLLHFAIDAMGRTQSDLAKLLGSSPRASEILRRKRRLTLDMVRVISREWHLPIEALTADYELAREQA